MDNFLNNHNITQAIENSWKNRENSIALIYKLKKYSFRDLKVKSEFYKNLIIENKNNHNKRLVILSYSPPEVVAIILACGEIGWLCCPLNNELKNFQLSIQIKKINPSLIFCDKKIINEDLINNFQFNKSLFIGLDNFEFPITERKISNNKNLLNEDFLLTCSSGSTGSPKPILFSQKNKLMRAAMAIETWDIDNKDTIINASPIHHSLGQRLTILPLLAGAKLIILDKFNEKEWIENALLFDVSFTIPVISHLQKLSSNSTFWDLVSSKFFKAIVASSSRLDGKLREKIFSNKNNFFYEMYGASEVGTASVLNPNKMLNGLNSVGKPIKNVNIKIYDLETKDEINNGQIGEIAISSIYQFKGYLDDYKLTQNSYIDNYFLTGDLGYIDNNQYLYYKGRKDDCFNVGGIKTYSEDIENIILANFELEECKVFGINQEYFGNVPVLAFVPKDKKLKIIDFERKIRAFCAINLAPFQVPHLVIGMNYFPKHSNGKLDRIILKNTLIEKFEDSIN